MQRVLMVTTAALPIPPVLEKTKGEKVPCSTWDNMLLIAIPVSSHSHSSYNRSTEMNSDWKGNRAVRCGRTHLQKAGLLDCCQEG